MAQKTQISPNPFNGHTPPPMPQMPNSAPTQGNSLYGRSEDKPNINRTVIQGMKPKKEETPGSDKTFDGNKRITEIELQERPVAGILYSLSHDSLGELFPLYAGRNTIGSSNDCDVYLTEQTVSPKHAILLIRILDDGKGGRHVTMSITDYNSEYGTSVNGEKLDFDKVNLNGNEIIEIGNSYKFIFLRIDADAYGLKPASNFIATPRKENRPAPQQVIVEKYILPNGENIDDTIYPNSVGEQDENTFYGRTKAQKVDHSSKKTIL